MDDVDAVAALLADLATGLATDLNAPDPSALWYRLGRAQRAGRTAPLKYQVPVQVADGAACGGQLGDTAEGGVYLEHSGEPVVIAGPSC
jgi:hypothetical protein